MMKFFWRLQLMVRPLMVPVLLLLSSCGTSTLRSVKSSGTSNLSLSSTSRHPLAETARGRTPTSDEVQESLQEKVQAYRNEYAFDWPIDRARLSRGYNPLLRRPHLGIDLAAPRKTPVYASHQGLVIYAGRDFRGFGKMILIESGHGWATLYAHLDQILIEEGQTVKMGESIGLVGSTGRSSGPHLHFEIRKNKGPVDPLLYLPGGLEAARKLAKKSD
jgi:murein DD-endopeptidase MepM/ murein hydrolase activator NlpD